MITAIHLPIGEKIASLTKIGLIGFIRSGFHASLNEKYALTERER